MKEYNTQICTTIEQSKELLAAGLNINTADMCHRPIVENQRVKPLICANPPRPNVDIPAWSLHRLLHLACKCRTHGYDDYYEVFVDIAFEDIVEYIKMLLKRNMLKNE